MISVILRSTIGRWVTGLLITGLLSGAVYWWYDRNEDLRDEGRQECIQKVNEETHRIAVEALAAERAANVALQEQLRVAQDANARATKRRTEAELELEDLRKQMEEQEKNDEEYNDWASTPLPDGVAERLRQN